MIDRQFRQHIAILAERRRREAQSQADVLKKPPAAAKAKQPSKNTRKPRSA